MRAHTLVIADCKRAMGKLFFIFPFIFASFPFHLISFNSFDPVDSRPPDLERKIDGGPESVVVCRRSRVDFAIHLWNRNMSGTKFWWKSFDREKVDQNVEIEYETLIATTLERKGVLEWLAMLQEDVEDVGSLLRGDVVCVGIRVYLECSTISC
jgi:hypothetical protein